MRSKSSLGALALACAGCAALQPSLPELDFREQLVGTASLGSVVDWTNWSPNPIRVDGIAVGGPDFRMISPNPFTSTVLAPGRSTPTLSFSFAPTREGKIETTAIPLTLSGLPANADALRLKGEGIVPVLPEGGYLGPVTTSPRLTAHSSMDFGDIPTGTRSYRTLTLYNRGSLDRPVFIRFGGVDTFSAASTALVTSPIRSVTVPANGRITIVLVFDPGAIPGDYTDTGVFESGWAIHLNLDVRGRAHRAQD